MTQNRYKVLIVDDSAFMRKLIRNVILTDPAFEIIGFARNGRETVEQFHKLKPDLVTMDVQMPEMDGLQTLSWIMREHPIPVIMISSFTQSGAKETIRALELGAFDFVTKPAMKISYSLQELTDELLGKMRAAVHAKPRRTTASRASTIPANSSVQQAPQSINKPTTLPATEEKQPPAKPTQTHTSSPVSQIVAIGTSTGGPGALHEVFSHLPANLQAPVLIVQHMPANFTRSLAERLNTVSALHVKEAEDGDILQNGHAYLAPGGYHMTVRFSGGAYRIRIDQEPSVSGHRPSVNKMFESLLPLSKLKWHVVLMTGMGSDGASAMLKLRQSGAITTIAESEKTCIVYGMPKAAVQLDAVDYILHLPEIAKKIVEVVNN